LPGRSLASHNWSRPASARFRKSPDIKMTSDKYPTLALRFGSRIESWPIAGSFTISRGAKREAVTVVAEVSQGGLTGRGECVPYPRYDETAEATVKALQSADALAAVVEGLAGARPDPAGGDAACSTVS
jgi:hypothetical protein